MANATSIAGVPALLAASTANQSIALDPEREYTVQHLAFDVSGVAAETAIFLGIDATAVASYAASATKAVLQSAKALIVGPNVLALNFITASGTPTFQLIPAPKSLNR